ncbi:MAG: hypothetical protein KDK37_04865, partial [Leptospiraceae bacterium]|nr:hypothetical protein [Leptospiraceae bacterium]
MRVASEHHIVRSLEAEILGDLQGRRRNVIGDPIDEGRIVVVDFFGIAIALSFLVGGNSLKR